jgi:hypothetical protein
MRFDYNNRQAVKTVRRHTTLAKVTFIAYLGLKTVRTGTGTRFIDGRIDAAAPTHEQIARRAYELYSERGEPGSQQED